MVLDWLSRSPSERVRQQRSISRHAHGARALLRAARPVHASHAPEWAGRTPSTALKITSSRLTAHHGGHLTRCVSGGRSVCAALLHLQMLLELLHSVSYVYVVVYVISFSTIDVVSSLLPSAWSLVSKAS